MTTDQRETRADHLAGDHRGRPEPTCPACTTTTPTADAQRAAANDQEDDR